MRRVFWRYSRPVGCLLCVCLLLVLAWLIRLVSVPPAAGVETQIRRAERRCLRPPGELAEIYDEGSYYPYAVTKRDGELYTYFLTPQALEGKGRKRCTGANCWRDSAGDQAWGCSIGPFYQFELTGGSTTQVQWMYVLVKNSDPAVTAGRLTIETGLGAGEEAHTRTWTARAERRDPDYLSFRLELRGGRDSSRELFSTLYNGVGSKETTAMAEAVFYDADGNEAGRLQFDMLTHEEERSEENGA